MGALGFGLSACASSGEPYSVVTVPTTQPATDPASVLAGERAAHAERVDLLACDDTLEGATGESFAVAFVGPSSESRELAAPLPMPGLGNESAQLRALVDHLNACGGRPIELHVHRDYTLGDDFSLGRLCDDVTVNERNDLVIARGLPSGELRCVADSLPVLYLGDAERESGKYFSAIGADADRIEATLMESLAEANAVLEGTLGVIYDSRFSAFVERHHADDIIEAVDFDQQVGCDGLDAARSTFSSTNVTNIVVLLDERCLPSAGLALKSLRAQWIIGPLGVGTGDDAIASIAAVGDTFDGAYAITGTPRGILRDRVPSAPPALGEACNTVTSTQGEDYEFGIGEYAALEQLCIAISMTRRASQLENPTPASITDALRSHTEFPLPSNLLGGFRPGSSTSADDVFYVQRYSARCGCWEYVAGPIARE